VAGTLRPLLAGQTVGNWRAADGENYDVRVRLAPEAPRHAADLRPCRWWWAPPPTAARAWCGCRRWPTSRPSTGPNQINRRDLNREINIDANTLGRSAGEVSADIRAVLDGIAWPPGYRYSFGGSTKNMQDSFGYALARWRWRWSSST
jgi:hydrophobic/amphiphilic exporter-1 (mainly G- bacteria), HAE1 family